ncbi:MAG: GIY-YIG nuclease family protein [Candidatus Jacksonbacteria bacterium]|nr:GIY-YIG nuclease family protein [Candidatus Jacksonbacteria bacterium]
MYYVYILRSIKERKLYIGFTGDLKRRFHEHKDGLVNSTKQWLPVELIYYEAYKDAKDARERERKLKHFKRSYMELRKRIHYSTG